MKQRNSVFSLCSKKSSSSLLCACFFPVSLLYSSHKTLHFWHFWSPNVGGVSPTTRRSLWHQLVHYNLTQFCHYVPRVNIQSHRLPAQSHRTPTWTSDPSHKPRLSPVLLTNWVEIGDSNSPFLGSINLPEQFTALRETLTYMYQFIKGYRWTARRSSTKGRVREDPEHRYFCPYGVGVSRLPVWVCSLTWKIPEPHSNGILGRLPHRGMINY